jgi:uncharacterized protein
VTELRRRPGTQREVTLSVPVPDLAITTARVPDGAEVVIDATLEAIEGGITITGAITVPWSGECRRCLDEVRGELTVQLRELFEPRPTAGETYPIEGDDVDLEPLVRDTVLLNLPLAPLCGPDCLGPAPDQFPTLVAGVGATDGDATGGAEPPRDPRWAALDVLRTDPEG